jgi:polyisoprenoid-binding protein YceI
MTTTLTEQRAAAPKHWSVDDAESFVEFAVKTFWGLTAVRGRFRPVRRHLRGRIGRQEDRADDRR